MEPAQTRGELAIVRDASREPSRRAFAAAVVAAGGAAVREDGSASAAGRMFGYEERHDAALVWDGRASRSGTITYVDDQRVEQYVGRQTWVAYRRAQLPNFAGDVGDQLRITPRAGAIVVETIGPNRLEAGPAAAVREASSGMLVLRTSELFSGELESCARDVAERYAAGLDAGPNGISLDFRGGARLGILAAAPRSHAGCAAAQLLTETVATAVRLRVTVASNRLEAALDAERALMLCAGLLAADTEAIALDDTGALFSAEQLRELGARNEMRADAFAFTAAAIARQCRRGRVWFSDRQGVCDELNVFSSRPWRADFAATFLRRELTALSDAAGGNDDPIVPRAGELFAIRERGETGRLERLATLRYDAVEVDVSFLDTTRLPDDLRHRIEARNDIEMVLGRPAASAIVIAFGNRGADTESDRFALEMRRAETLATTLAAAFAGRVQSVATDVAGTLFDRAELVRLAVRRSGKSASWSARVAASVAAES